MVKLSIVIVNWNTADYLSKCLNSIKKYASKADVYVVDNASDDKSVEVVRKNFPWVKLTANNKNLGFAKGNNQILKKISSGYVFILNPDTILLVDTVQILSDFMDKNPDVAACGPLLLNHDKTVQRKGYYHRFPSILQVILFYTQLYYQSINNKFLVKNFWEEDFEKSPEEVEQIPGACIFARVKILKRVNFFDEDYPLWFEDVDLCFKLKKAGYKMMIVPSAKLIHFGGGSFQRWNNDVEREARFFNSIFLFFKKNSLFIEYILVRIIVILNYLYLILTRSIKQLITPTNDRKIFIFNKTKILWKLL